MMLLYLYSYVIKSGRISSGIGPTQIQLRVTRALRDLSLILRTQHWNLGHLLLLLLLIVLHKQKLTT